jgi:predicted GNAT family acetyltransferase
MTTEFTHRPNGDMGEFVFERAGKRLAQLNYARHGQRVEILHTEVDPVLRGEGIGAKLVGAAVDWARQEKLQILPLCPFAKAVFNRTPDYSDVLSPR